MTSNKGSDTSDPSYELKGLRITGSEGQSYYLKSVVGHGRYGCVYQCFDEKDASLVAYAAKVITKSSLSVKAVENLKREIKILQQIDDESVLRMHELLESSDFLFIIMPFVEGGELFKKVSGCGSFSEKEARRVLLQIARGLLYLHSHQICHRDIKPENILCSGEAEGYHVVIADFGLSRFYGREELMTTSCGTPPYAAPEVINHRGPYTEACDIWSFGVVAFVLFTGCFPFQNPTYTCSGSYDKFVLEHSGVSPAAREFIARLFRVNPAERPTAAYLVNEDPWLTATGGPDVDLTKSASRLGTLKSSERITTDDGMADDDAY